MAIHADTRRLIIYAGLALTVALALAVSVKQRAASQADTRSSQVITEFITLSASPDERGLDFLSRDRTQRANRTARLEHIQPEVLQEFAALRDMDVSKLRTEITEPALTNAFDHTGAIFDSPREMTMGQAGPWDWAYVNERANFRASDTAEPAACGQESPCRAWLLYWDDTAWYYAPIGTQAFDAALKRAVPVLATALDAGE